jgi:hypothetical protein
MMPNIGVLLARINLREAIDYFDRVRVWSKRLLTPQERQMLNRMCGTIRVTQPMTRDNPFATHHQKIEVNQPTMAALQLLAQLEDDAFVNYVEVARDHIVAGQSAEALDRLLRDHFLQLWHGKKGVVAYSAGFSTRQQLRKGQRRAGHWFNWYSDKTCRITGDPDCFHFEGKHEGRRCVRRLGIEHPRDLLQFDFGAYFARHVTLYEIDFERLGRYDFNRVSGAKRKHTRIDRWQNFRFNYDRCRGGILYRLLSLHAEGQDRSLQRFVDQYGRGPFLRRSLSMIMGAQSFTSQERKVQQ